MATYSIARVHLVSGPGAYSHPHIGSVLLTTGIVMTRAEVIASIRSGNVFYTNASPPAKVWVHPCPFCYARDYITTHPDATPTNNLLHLPRF